MTSRATAPALGHYELRVEGHLDEHWSRWFDGLTLSRDGDGTTTLRGAVTDQAELHGLLAQGARHRRHLDLGPEHGHAGTATMGP